MINGILDSGQKIVTNGLVLNYDVCQLRSYPTTGANITDLSGNDYNGTLVNGTLFNTLNGGSLYFDGINDYLNCGNTLSYQNSFTFNIFFKSTTTSLQVIIGKFSVTGGDFFIGIISSKLVFSFGSPSKVDIESTINVSDGSWKMATAVFNRSLNSTFLYINGILNKTGENLPLTINEAQGNLMLGKFGDADNYNFKGNISLFNIYNRALTSTEVLQNFNANRLRYGL